MRIIIIASLILYCCFSGYAQSMAPVSIKYFDESNFDGKISLEQSSGLANYMETYTGLNKKRRGFYGYRIKIFAQNNTDARNQANSIRLAFEESYKGHRAHLAFVEPNFEVQVGDFMTRFEAVAFLNQISARYPEAYIIRTIITFPNREVTKTSE